jgi:FkbM family methyltransferase
MGLGELIEKRLKQYREWRWIRMAGPIGDYYRGGGNVHLVQDLPVTSEDLVLDAGGFEGAWTAEMAWRYGCRSIIFEPMPLFVDQLRRRFRDNSRISIRPEGIGPRNEALEFVLASDESSAIKKSGEFDQKIVANIVDVKDVFDMLPDTEIGCMKVNIEGSEYELIDRMLETDLVRRVRTFVVQFHDFVPDAPARHRSIEARMRLTHDLKWQYPFIWERWDLKRS